MSILDILDLLDFSCTHDHNLLESDLNEFAIFKEYSLNASKICFSIEDLNRI